MSLNKKEFMNIDVNFCSFAQILINFLLSLFYEFKWTFLNKI